MNTNIDAVCEQRKEAADKAYDEFEAARKAFDAHWNSAAYTPEDAENYDADDEDAKKKSEPKTMDDPRSKAFSHSAIHNVDSGTKLAEAASKKANEGAKHTVDSYYAMDIENARAAINDNTRGAFESAVEAAKDAAKTEEEDSNFVYEGNTNAFDRTELRMHSNF